MIHPNRPMRTLYDQEWADKTRAFADKLGVPYHAGDTYADVIGRMSGKEPKRNVSRATRAHPSHGAE